MRLTTDSINFHFSEHLILDRFLLILYDHWVVHRFFEDLFGTFAEDLSPFRGYIRVN